MTGMDTAPEFPNRGTGFTETETLLAALDDDATDEVDQRVAAMLPGERRILRDACSRVSAACEDARRGEFFRQQRERARGGETP